MDQKIVWHKILLVKTGTCRVYTLISVGITDKDVFLQRQPAPPVSKLYTKLNYWLLDLD